MSVDLAHLGSLVQTLAWMGGDMSWPADVIAEQLGEFDDPRIRRSLEEATAAGLVLRDDTGYRLTDAGWALAEVES
ncbi:MAG: hypothetical protein ACRDNK_09475 [Solirubrobacteraceae bacterium]